MGALDKNHLGILYSTLFLILLLYSGLNRLGKK